MKLPLASIAALLPLFSFSNAASWRKGATALSSDNPQQRARRLDNKLTEEQIEQFREAFSLFDNDGNGHISPQELYAVLRSLGQNPTDEELAEMIAQVDNDSSGNVTFDEFLILMTSTMEDTDVIEEIREAFAIFDSNGDGKVTEAELGVLEPVLGPFFEEVDADGDGSLDRDEFVDLILASNGYPDGDM